MKNKTREQKRWGFGIVHIKKHEDGGITISIPALAAMIIAVIGMVISPAIVYGSLNERVDNMETRLDLVGPEHEKHLSEINQRLNIVEKSTIQTEVILKNIDVSLTEIKIDIRELRDMLD